MGDSIAPSPTATPGTCTPVVESLAGSYTLMPNLGLVCSANTLDNRSDTNSAMLPFCRICHAPGDEKDPLTSPCRCAGTLQFIHGTCLMVSRVGTLNPNSPLYHNILTFILHRPHGSHLFVNPCPAEANRGNLMHMVWIYPFEYKFENVANPEFASSPISTFEAHKELVW